MYIFGILLHCVNIDIREQLFTRTWILSLVEIELHALIRNLNKSIPYTYIKNIIEHPIRTRFIEKENTRLMARIKELEQSQHC